MIVQAPAKINLTLRVLGKRADGYHELESVMQLLTLADTLDIEPADDLSFTCSDPELECENNLVLRAARLLHERCSRAPGAHIHLTKKIPAQAGLGGGSSDAATTLAALNEMWDIRVTPAELYAIAGQLGSDVPFFLDGPTAVVRGRGEEVIPIKNTTVCHVVVIKPSKGLSTPEVYANLHAHSIESSRTAELHPVTHAMLQALGSGDAEAIARALANDLEGPALAMMPELFLLRERMVQLGCLGILLCGSGSAMFGICPDEGIAKHAAIDLRNDCPWTWAGPWVPFR
ncbi:MAG: 4-(cytidine 5'-diphospho)-2-C-methyl-D-erythritol kinase [Armatimonadota bacterium]